MQKSIRLLKIWKLCREKRMMTAPKLAEMCCVTERTIYRDIQALGEAGVLISYNKGYYIAEENPLPQLALSREEQLVLTLALQNFPLHMDEELEDVVSGLLNKLLESPLNDSGIALDASPATPLKGHVFNRLQKAIDARRKATLVEYYHLDGKLTRNRTVEPYLLAFRERNWHLVAWTPQYRDFRIYRMSRITRLRVEEQVFRPRPFNPREYFKGSLGIIVDKPQRMKACFSGLAKEIVKKDGRFSPKDMREEDGNLFLETTINGEIQWLRWLLGFGGEVEILESAGMREKAIRMMREGLAGYGAAAE